MPQRKQRNALESGDLHPVSGQRSSLCVGNIHIETLKRRGEEIPIASEHVK